MRKTSTVVAPIHMHLLESRCFLSAGQLDTSFDTDGLATASWAAEVHDALVLPNGKIFVVGTTQQNGQYQAMRAPAVARYNANGSLDTTFGINGVSPPIPDISGDGRDIAVQSDGKIIVAVNVQNKIVRVAMSGQMSVVASGAPLDFPASVVIDSMDAGRRLLFTNAALFSGDAGRPGVLALPIP